VPEAPLPSPPAAPLLQISDTHFGTENPAVQNALLSLARQIAPELVVWSGDITQRATRAQFAAARAFADQLAPAPVLAIPGNHDIPLFDLLERAASPYARHREAFGPVLEPLHISSAWRVVGVKTTRRWRHRHGQVSPRQAEAVAARLRGAAPEQIRVVVVHQPVAVARAQDAIHLLRGGTAAARRWMQAGADIVMGGHIHLPYVLPLHAPAAQEDGPARDASRAWCVQAGTAISTRTRPQAGNSVNVLRHGRGPLGRLQAVVERWDYQPHPTGPGCFTLATTHVLDLSRMPHA